MSCVCFLHILPSGIHVAKIPPKPSTLQSQLSQPLLIQQMLQSLSHTCGLLLDLLLYVHVCLVVGIPELDPAIQPCLITTAE